MRFFDMAANYRAALADIDGMIGIAALLAVAAVLAYRPAGRVLARLHIPPALALAGVALLAGLLGAGGRVMTYDETFTAAISSLSPDQIVIATAGDVHPPAYYLAVRAVRQIAGSSESALRLWSAVCAAVAAALVYRIGRRYLTPGHALTAGYVAAFLPGLLIYAQTARMYTMLAALVLAAFWAALNGRWLLFVGAAGLAVYTHNYGWLYVLALAPLWIPERRGRLALAAVAGLYLPWLAGGLALQISHVGTGFWIQPLSLWRMFEPALVLGTGITAPPVMTLGLLGLFFLLSGAGLWSILTMYPALFSDFSYEIALRNELRWAKNRVSLLSVLIVPMILAAVASVVFQPVYLARGFIAGVYLLPVCWLAWLAGRPVWVRRAAAAALVAAVVFHYAPASAGMDVRGLIKKAAIQPDDQLYHIEIASLITLEYYTPDSGHYLYPYASDLSQSLTGETSAAMGLQSVAYEDLPAAGGRRLLVVCRTPFTTPAQEAEIARLLARPQLTMVATLGDSMRTFTVYEDGGL